MNVKFYRETIPVCKSQKYLKVRSRYALSHNLDEFIRAFKRFSAYRNAKTVLILHFMHLESSRWLIKNWLCKFFDIPKSSVRNM